MNTDVIRKLWITLSEILFPPRCVACGKKDSHFCANCRKKLPVRGNSSHDGIFSLWEYRHPAVRNALLALKYKNKRMLAADIAESLRDDLLERLAEKSAFSAPLSSLSAHSACIVVPIPLSKRRFKKRGYNQAELLAKELSRQDPVSFILETRVLCKIKDTDTQVSVMDRAKRLQNIRGSFAIRNPEKIRGKTVLVVDDVITTGATLAEARRMLFKAGARRVYGVTVAH